MSGQHPGDSAAAPSNHIPSHQIDALLQACLALIDLGLHDRARAIAELLIARTDLDTPIREGVLARLATAERSPWRGEIEAAIASRQPFLLYYEDAEGHSWQFAVRSAAIKFRNRRSYLDVWTDEAVETDPLPALAHNRTLRLDRIKYMYMLPMAGNWREGLDELAVEMKLSGRLVKDYEAGEDDTLDVMAPDGSTRRIVRRVTSGFWFLREVLGWGANAEVIAPAAMRDLVKQQLDNARATYA